MIRAMKMILAACRRIIAHDRLAWQRLLTISVLLAFLNVDRSIIAVKIPKVLVFVPS